MMNVTVISRMHLAELKREFPFTAEVVFVVEEGETCWGKAVTARDRTFLKTTKEKTIGGRSSVHMFVHGISIATSKEHRFLYGDRHGHIYPSALKRAKSAVAKGNESGAIVTGSYQLGRLEALCRAATLRGDVKGFVAKKQTKKKGKGKGAAKLAAAKLAAAKMGEEEEEEGGEDLMRSCNDDDDDGELELVTPRDVGNPKKKKKKKKGAAAAKKQTTTEEAQMWSWNDDDEEEAGMSDDDDDDDEDFVMEDTTNTSYSSFSTTSSSRRAARRKRKMTASGGNANSPGKLELELVSPARDGVVNPKKKVRMMTIRMAEREQQQREKKSKSKSKRKDHRSHKEKLD